MSLIRCLNFGAEYGPRSAYAVSLLCVALASGACTISPDISVPNGFGGASSSNNHNGGGTSLNVGSGAAPGSGSTSSASGAGSVSVANGGSSGAHPGSNTGSGVAGNPGSGGRGSGLGSGGNSSGLGSGGSGVGSGAGGSGSGLGSGGSGPVLGTGGSGLGVAGAGSQPGQAGAGSGVGGSPGASGSGTTPSQLPTAKGTCAPFASGKMTFGGLSVTVWSAAASNTQSGPLVMYWHGTGSSGQEAVSALGQASINEITSQGGVVASFEKSTGKGSNTGDAVWFTGDFEIADEIVACGIAQKRVDPRQIYTAGYSAGGLQSAWMAYARSGYLAAVVTYSGGSSGLGAVTAQDPKHVPPALCAHGGAGKDVFILDFAQASAKFEADLRKRGVFAIDCDDGSSHIDIATRFKAGPSAWRFLKDHPFGVTPEPYSSGLPSGFPSYCKILP